MASIQTIPEVAEEHTSKIKSIQLKTTAPTVSVNYTDIGAIHQGVTLNTQSASYAKNIEEDIKNFASDLVDMASKKVADDKSAAKGFK
ncbi:hypothetical protein [Lactococcus allomyrinae]|uniref:Uncharacterized protein n=1 Tax=Lactococcus allomyrinae TaxID=2419773 RepID=A0A387BMU5_9LACT|nr:hypothetical protein [Lactococcus allomyrinae]AYF99850.1 hypothetical protein D7I46_01380 [Lactococcus allomyrinae]